MTQGGGGARMPPLKYGSELHACHVSMYVCACLYACMDVRICVHMHVCE